jgi:phosphopantothenoylcysteine decarboxylase/phosphopantothenate--cysteine ligase
MPSKKPIRLLVTAGPTREMLDPVRFISNVSTGEMGYAIARRARQLGFQVVLISGPTAIQPPENVRLIQVLTAEEMKRAIASCWSKTDILIMAAAVCDYAPAEFSRCKIKRVGEKKLLLKSTPDILKYFGKKKAGRILVGFALETEALRKNAAKKVSEKNLDLIVGNNLNAANFPFGTGKFSYLLIDRSGKMERFGRISKEQMATVLLGKIEDFWRPSQVK